MKDSISIKKSKDKFTISRTMSETVNATDFDERIKKVEGDVEAYEDTLHHLKNNKEQILKDNADKIDRDIQAYENGLVNLQANLQALKDAKVLGKGSATSIQNGDTVDGVTE